MCVMCSTSVPTLFQYFFYDHIPTFLYIFHEMFLLLVTIHFRKMYKILPSGVKVVAVILELKGPVPSLLTAATSKV